jgi:hypothetical protein
MKTGEYVNRRAEHHPRPSISRRTLASARAATPIAVRAFVRARGFLSWRAVLVAVGVLVQLVLTVLMWQLVDLTISLMEVWAELARKHLEITL